MHERIKLNTCILEVQQLVQIRGGGRGLCKRGRISNREQLIDTTAAAWPWMPKRSRARPKHDITYLDGEIARFGHWLAVEPQQVVLVQCDAGDGWLGAGAAMRFVPMQLSSHRGSSAVRSSELP